MSSYYPATESSIAANVMLRKQRLLPVPGDVLMPVNTHVGPDDILASVNIPGRPAAVDVAGALGVKPRAGARAVKIEVGQRVEVGHILAARRQGLNKMLQVRSPLSGIFTGYDPATGLATVAPDGVNFELRAWISGVVTEQIPASGVVIETSAAVVRGIVGVGGERHGVLRVAVAGPTEELLPEQITDQLANSIVLGGGTITAAGLRRAVENNVRAIIVGSISAVELRTFLGYPDGTRGWALGRLDRMFPPPVAGPESMPQPPLTLIVVDGFGRLPMTERAWELLASFDRQEVSVDGRTRLGAGIACPEVIVPLAGALGTPQAGTTGRPLTVRSTVRLIAPPYLGQTGRVVALSQGRQAIPSGIVAQAAQVELPDKATVWVPVTNVEVIG